LAPESSRLFQTRPIESIHSAARTKACARRERIVAPGKGPAKMTIPGATFERQ
jgi:hypothetical protein